MSQKFRVKPGCSVLVNGVGNIKSGGIVHEGMGNPPLSARWIAENVGLGYIEAVSAVDAGNAPPGGINAVTPEAPGRTAPIPIGTPDAETKTQPVVIGDGSSGAPVVVNTTPNPAVPVGLDGKPIVQETPTGQSATVVSTPGAPTVVTTPAPAQVSQRTSVWDTDPASLKGKKLAELNAMIAERDPKAPAMDTIAEAVALLSKDFKKSA